MTDKTKYRNVSLSHKVYNDLIKISETKVDGVKLSISKTIELLTFEEKNRLNTKTNYIYEQIQN
tara:strand:+ start:418 stop:609 length:192 start_codon:yes stop_codon:yes gene_type:complete